MKISKHINPLLIFLPTLIFVSSPFPTVLNTSDNMTNSSGLSSEALERLTQLEQIVNETQQEEEQAQKIRALLQQQREEEKQQQELQARRERALLQQQQNYSSYEDPILGIRFEYPSWWEISQVKNLIRFELIGDPKDPMYYNTTKTLDRYTIASILYVLPSLLKEMNTNDRFMRQTMIDLKFLFPYVNETQNISVNKTSTIGVDDLPAYKVESEDVLGVKNIRYFSIDNSTGVGYMISLNTNMTKLQEDVPSFERLVGSFKILP